MRTLKWTWESKHSKIKIYDGTNLIGHIPGLDVKEVGIINGKKFFLDYTPIVFSRPFICDPDEKNKAYCEIDKNKLICPAFEYVTGQTLFWPFKRKLFLSGNGKKKVEIEIPGGFFVKSGTIYLYEETNYELSLYALFLLNTMGDGGG